MKKQLFLIACSVLLINTVIFADNATYPTDHAPIGVMGDHTHKKGEFMGSLRWMRMSMDGMISGDNSVSNSQARSAGFMMVPEDMTMDMTMLGLMYGLTDKATIMVMLPYLDNKMTMRRLMNNAESEMKSSGLGDVSVTTLYSLFKDQDSSLHINLGLSLPTGAIDEKDGAALNLPYPMQLGSGSYGLIYGYTYNKSFGKWSTGHQFRSIGYLGQNENDYKLGNEYQLTEWIARRWSDVVSTSLRLTYFQRGNITGADSDVVMRQMMMSSPLNTTQTGRENWTVGFGVNLLGQQSWVKGHRLALEYVVPIAQRTASTQLEIDNTITLGWQKVF